MRLRQLVPRLSQMMAGLQEPAQDGGGPGCRSTRGAGGRKGPQLGRRSTELPQIGCSTPLLNMQKQSAAPVDGNETITAAPIVAWNINLRNPITASNPAIHRFGICGSLAWFSTTPSIAGATSVANANPAASARQKPSRQFTRFVRPAQ
jgi:hypothetical protein